MTFRIQLFLLFLVMVLSACQKRSIQSTPEFSYTQNDFVKETYVQKEIAGDPKENSYYYLHLLVKDTLPGNAELRGITFIGQYFTLNPFQTIYKFKLKDPENGLHQKATLRYVNKTEEVTVVKSKSIIIAIPQKEDLFLP